MRWSSFTLLGIVAWQVATAQPPPGYYAPAQGLTGQALAQALHDIISGHAVQSNASLWTHFQSTDARQDGFVWDIYSDIPGGVPPYVYAFGVDQCGTYNSEGDCYNREHTVPQSWFNSAAPMNTDLFHVYPTDAWVNQQRGNWPYAEVATASWTSQNGTRVGTSATPGYQGTVCEPLEAFKGDLARTYFYMAIRYAPNLATWSGPMFVSGGFSTWAEALLLDWHAGDPVDAKELERNNAVFAIQGNRNPFIDQPDWVWNLWGPTASLEERPHAGSAWIVLDPQGISLTGLPSDAQGIYVLDMAGRILWADRSPQEGPVALVLSNGPYMAVLERTTQREVIRFVR